MPGIVGIRNMRYGRDSLPEKWRDALQTNYRFRANLTSSEILRVTAMATRNPPRIVIESDQVAATAERKAQKQTRWVNALFPALERQAGEPLLRRFADAEVEAGLGAFEIFETGLRDDLDEEFGEDEDVSDDEINEALRVLGLPIGLRVIDPMTIVFERDQFGLSRVVITEYKRESIVFKEWEKKNRRSDEDERQPTKFARGWARNQGYDVDSTGNVETIRYYDRRWFAWIVGGKAETIEEHGMPGVPVITSWGQTTSSSNISEQMMGITAGMVQMEQALNDAMTLALDIGVTFARPKPVIETPIEGSLRTGTDGRPTNIDLSGKNGVPQLEPGQKVVDAAQAFQSHLDPGVLQTILQLWQRAGLNPIAAGQSPGADPAGFTVNTLQASAMQMYEVLLDNMARAIGQTVDFIREWIKETYEEEVSLAVGDESGAIEWMGLGPDDITDVPAKVFIDPLNDVNRLAVRQSLLDGNARGMVPRRIVQMQGFGAADSDEWDDEIIEDQALELLSQQIVQDALATVRGMMAGPEPSGLVDQFGNPLSSGGGLPLQPGDVGAEPARLNPASVGEAGEPSRNGGSPTVGRAGGRNPAAQRAGQQPNNQPVPPARGR